MGHGKESRTEAPVEPPDFVAKLLAELLVETCERLVEQQDRRFENEGASERHTLPLSTGKLMHAPSFEAVKGDKSEHVCNTLPPNLGSHAPEAKAVSEILRHSHVRKKAKVLEYCVARPHVRCKLSDIFSVEQDAAERWGYEAADHL
jgi:hypothetical protein